MQTTEPITHPAGVDARPTVAEMVEEAADLIEFVPVAGPPAILLAAPLVLLALMVAGPFVALLTIVAVLVLAALLVALVCAVVASPYLLVRHFRGRRAAGARKSSSGARSPRLVPVRSQRAAA